MDKIRLNFNSFIPTVRHALLLDLDSKKFPVDYILNGLEYKAYMACYSTSLEHDVSDFVENELFVLVDKLANYLIVEGTPVYTGADIHYKIKRLDLSRRGEITRLSYNHSRGLDDDNEYILSFIKIDGKSQITMEYFGIKATIFDTSDIASYNIKLLGLIGYFVAGLVYKLERGENVGSNITTAQDKLIKTILGEY